MTIFSIPWRGGTRFLDTLRYCFATAYCNFCVVRQPPYFLRCRDGSNGCIGNRAGSDRCSRQREHSCNLARGIQRFRVGQICLSRRQIGVGHALHPRPNVGSAGLSARAVCVMVRRPQQRSARRARQGQKKPRRSGGIRQMRCCCSSCRHFSLVSVTLGMPHPLCAGMVPLVYAYLLCHGVEGQSVITPSG